MARRIVLTSGKGGVGKSTLCLTLGRELAKSGANVVLLDVDVGLHNLDIIAGISQKIVFDVVDVIEEKVRLSQALIQDEQFSGLYFLPSCHLDNVGKVSVDGLKKVLKELENFDYVLLDCPAGIDFGFHASIFCASEAIIVTTPNLSSVNAADKVASLLCNYNLVGVGLVVNRMQKVFLKKQQQFAENISKALKLPLFGTFFENKEISKHLGVMKSQPSDRGFRKSATQFSNNVFYGNYEKQFLKGV